MRPSPRHHKETEKSLQYTLPGWKDNHHCDSYAGIHIKMSQLSKANFERCCRLCAEEQEAAIMIFSQEAEAMLLQNKLNKYLLIEVEEDDKLPKNICIQCCTKLQVVCEFIDVARQAQDVLLNQSLMLDEVISEKCVMTPIKHEIPSDPDEGIEEVDVSTKLEVRVDPMMVLQNSEEPASPEYDSNGSDVQDVTYLHAVDAENVTIKLIRKSDSTLETIEMKKLKPFPCTTCRRSFCSELALKNHLWVHPHDVKYDAEEHKCNTCLEIFDYKCDLIAHLKEHRVSGRCQFCSRMFRSEKTYIAHMSIHLPSNKSFTCKICRRSYKTWGNLRTHSITHSTDRPYQCHYCKKNYKRNQDLKFHINQHTGAKPYKCPFCDKCFASSANCYSHRSRMHPGKPFEGKVRRRNSIPRDSVQLRPIAPKPPIKNVKGIVKYQCKYCDNTFMRRDNFTYHMYQHTGEKPFQCSLCDEKFVTRRGLLLHHEKEHPTSDRPLALLTKNMLLK